jgi:D-lactate dehydrogenase
MKIVIFEIEPWERQAFEGLQNRHEGTGLNGETAEQYADAEIMSTFIYSYLDRDVLQKFYKLRLIATRSKGFDHK